MKSAKILLVAALALGLTGTSSLAWYLYDQNSDLNAKLLADDSDALKGELAAARKSIHSLQDQIASLRKRRRAGADGGAFGDDAGGPDGPGGGRFGRGGFFGRMAALSNDPAFQKLMAIQMRGRVDQTYAGLFKALSLSPQQLAQFQDLLTQKQQALTDALQAARDQGISPRSDPADFKQVLNDAQSQTDQQIMQQLGTAGYQQYQQYEQQLPDSNTASQVATLLSYSSTPLTADQQTQLTQLLAQTQTQHAGNGTAGDNGDVISPTAVLNGGGYAHVTVDTLTAAQQEGMPAPVIQALQQIQDTQQAQAQAQAQARAAARAAAAAAAPAPAAPPP